VAPCSLNERAVALARRLAEARRYVSRVIGATFQPRAEKQNAFLGVALLRRVLRVASGTYRRAPDQTKARSAFVYGDSAGCIESGLIACHYRASSATRTSSSPRTSCTSCSTKPAGESPAFWFARSANVAARRGAAMR
jgi:hypothetical protein